MELWNAFHVFSIGSVTVETALMRPLRLVPSKEGKFAEWTTFVYAPPEACKHDMRVTSTNSFLNPQLKLNYLNKNRSSNKQTSVSLHGEMVEMSVFIELGSLTLYQCIQIDP